MVILVGEGAAFYFDGWIYCCTEIMSCCSRRFFVAFIYTVAGQRAAFWHCLGVHSAVCVCVCGCVCVCVCVCVWIMGPESSSSSHCSGPNPALPGSQLTLWLVMAVLRLFHRKKWATIRRVKSRRGGEKHRNEEKEGWGLREKAE